MAADRPIIDAQLHEPPVFLTWPGEDTPALYDLMTELQLAHMDAVGVDKAVLFPLDDAWGTHAVSRCPDRFTTVPMISATGLPNTVAADDPGIEEFIADRASSPGTAGIRILLTTSGLIHEKPHAGVHVDSVDEFEKVLAACARENMPLFMSTAGALEGPAEIARRHPELILIVDHMGFPQGPTFTRDDPPFRSLPKLLELAQYPNINVKLTGAPTLSEESFPFNDLWPHLEQMVEAFGASRLMWGSDISRVRGRSGFRLRVPSGEVPYPGRHSYAEALLYLRETDRLSAEQKSWILGGTASRVLDRAGSR